MLSTVAWFFWNPEGWVLEWEPIVVFVLTFASFIAADTNDVSGNESSKIDQSHPNDILLAKQFLEILPANGIMRFLKEHDFLGAFKQDKIEAVNRFSYEWSSPEHEFNDAELESLRKTVLEATIEFNNCIAKYTSQNSRGLQAVKVDGHCYDRVQQQRFSEEATRINNAADLVVESHAFFVRAARAKLDLT